MADGEIRHPADRMKRGYAQHTQQFGLFMQHQPQLQRVLFMVGSRMANYYRREAARGRSRDVRSADTVKVIRQSPGGRKRDRMEFQVKAKFKNKAGIQTLKNSVVYVSQGKKVSRKGQVSG